MPAELTEKRATFISELQALANEMRHSHQPGLEEYEGTSRVGGDYKMTIKQYSQFLADAGFTTTGYFEGPQPVGTATDALDHGACETPIALKPGEDHAGGVWVIRATRDAAQASDNTRQL